MVISVALCTYNGANFITEQLESICTQTVPPNEIVISDDGSTDDTIGCIEEVKNDFPSIEWKIIRNTANLGYVKNFEQAVSLTTGDVIFLSDQDDVWLPEKIEKIVSYTESHKEKELVFSNAEIVSSTLEPTGETMFDKTEFTPGRQVDFAKGHSFRLLLKHYYVTGATVAIKSSLKKWIIPFATVERHIHDGWMAVIASSMEKIGFLNEVLTLYRQHPAQTLGYFGGPQEDINEEQVATKGFFAKMHSTDYYKERLKGKKELYLHAKALNTEIIKRNIPITPANKTYLEKCIAFYGMHYSFAVNRWQRLLPITINLINGNYRLFDKSVLKKPVNDFLMKLEV